MRVAAVLAVVLVAAAASPTGSSRSRSEATTAAAHPGSAASAARPPPAVPTTPTTALAVNRLQPVVFNVGNFESKLLSAESVSEFLKTILRSVSPPPASAEVHRRPATEQPVVPGDGAVVPTPRAVSMPEEPSSPATSESTLAVTPAGHAEARKDQDVARRSTRSFNTTDVTTASPGRNWGPRERRPASSDAAMPPDDEDPPFGRGAATSGEMAAPPSGSHPNATAAPPAPTNAGRGDEAADGVSHRPPVTAAKPKRDTAAADESKARQFKMSTSTASVVLTVDAAGEKQLTTPAGRAASSLESTGRHAATVNGFLASASVANSWDHGNKTEETRSDAPNPTASTIGIKQLLFETWNRLKELRKTTAKDSQAVPPPVVTAAQMSSEATSIEAHTPFGALPSTSRPSGMSSSASTPNPSILISATTQFPQKSPTTAFLKTNAENGLDSSPPVRETRIEISDLADEVTTRRRPKSATMSNLAPSESFKPDRKAIVITFPNKLKNIQPGFKMDIKPGEDDRPARTEQTVVPSTPHFPLHRHSTLQPDETAKKSTAYHVTVTATPPSHTSTTHLAEATGAIKPFHGKQTGLMDSYIDAYNDNHTYIHISVLVTYFNDSRPLASETLSVKFKPRIGNSTDNAANNLKTMSEAIVSGLTKMPTLKRVLQGSDLAVERGIGPVTEPITTESHTSQAVSKSSHEYYRFSTDVDDILGRTTTARSISTSETSQNHVERLPNRDSKPEMSTTAPTRITAEGNTVVLYSETGDCSPEIADKISELEDYWKNDTEKVVIEMICRPAPVSISDTAYKGSRGKRSTLTETTAFKSRLSLAEGDSTVLDKNADLHSEQIFKPSKQGVMQSSQTVMGSTSIIVPTPPSVNEAFDIESRFDPGNKDIPVAAPFIKISEGDQLQHRKDAPDSDDPHKTSEGEVIRKYPAENDKNVQHSNHAEAKMHFERHNPTKPPETQKKSLAKSNSHDSRTTKPPHDHDESAHRSPKQSSRPLDDTITTEISQRRAATSAKRKKIRVMTSKRKKTTERSVSLDNATLADFEASERLDKNETEIEGDLSLTDQAFSASKYGPGPMKLEPTEGELRSVQMPPDTTSSTSPPIEHFRTNNYVSLSTATRNVPWVLHKLLSILEKLEAENITKNSKGTAELPQDITHLSSEPSTLAPQNNETTVPMHLVTGLGENSVGETKPVLQYSTFEQDYPHGRVFVPSELPWPTMENTESSTKSSTEKSHTPSLSLDFTISSSIVTKAQFFTVVEKRTVTEASVSPILSIISLPPQVTTRNSIKSYSAPRKYQTRGQSWQGLPLEFDGDSISTERTLSRAKVSRISARNLETSVQSYEKLDTCDSLCKPKQRIVCAQVGSMTRTFNSLCDVKVEGCIVGEATKIRHTGPCNRFKKRKTKVIIEQEDELVADDEVEDNTKASHLPIANNKNATLVASNVASEAAATTATSKPVKRTNKVDFIE